MQTTNPPYSQFWQYFGNASQSRQAVLFKQIQTQVGNLPLEGVSEVLNGANQAIKDTVWAYWSGKTDLSGYTLQDIVSTLETEPYSCVYGVIKVWLSKVDLSKYSLAQVKKTVTLLRDKADILKVWQRWSGHADLSPIGWDELIKSVKDLSPDIQTVVILAYICRSGNWKLYSAEEKNRNNKYIPSLVIKAATEVVKMSDASVIDWNNYEKYCGKDYVKP